jgi:N-acylglucosamine-6-phosphate 2-epimerase
MNSILESLHGRLIVSCQAPPSSPLARPEIISALARAAEQNGAAGVRIDSPENIRAVREHVRVPILGIYKIVNESSQVYITPTLESAREVMLAGADIVALDATGRPRPNGESLEHIVSGIQAEFHRPVMADIATFDEGMQAAEVSGVDLLSTTLAGYTDDTRHLIAPDFELVERLARGTSTPVICEGRLRRPEDVTRAFDSGAFAVVVGAAITGVDYLVQLFAAAARARQSHFPHIKGAVDDRR